ncbi:13750_t:CDS:2 [Gigaspora margarita]|uniref:13750_t:CDS:1 n=1 Tax=Gigaspora margarita TaxID=4874 RepID=A0ABN7WUG0_GIGMA|nr:13750_t:CDS:2 [Gigaspora margarita]
MEYEQKYLATTAHANWKIKNLFELNKDGINDCYQLKDTYIRNMKVKAIDIAPARSSAKRIVDNFDDINSFLSQDETASLASLH